MPLIDISGNKYSRLTVISYAGVVNRKSHWLCLCDCGNELPVRGDSLKDGNTQSCGCLKMDSATRHGHNSSKTGPSRTYTSWQSMIARCYNPRFAHYGRYGGRGIKICDRWRHSFNHFLEDMGERPDGHTLDRKDSTKGYSPNNCRWATPLEQSRNRSSGRFLTFEGRTLTVSEWADVLNISREVLQSRVQLGWDASRIITTPYQARVAKPAVKSIVKVSPEAKVTSLA